ncbi:SDR family NAD(P)-dependent oxidoreductase [Streptomyces sp. NPDC018352]|uniref:SDR family NAD(P)-dependent oxidoreductase n=1 Tax=Streptomyces sp. NPDC018352 TaxID=3157194 RepID=UPI003411BEC8
MCRLVSGRHQDVGEQLTRELGDLGAQVEFVPADVRFDADVKNLVDRAVARFGRIDVAFNNAGTEGTPGPVTVVTDETYQATFDTNVKGTLLSLKHVFRIMGEQGGGSIVNVSSLTQPTCASLARLLQRLGHLGPLHSSVGRTGLPPRLVGP